MNFFRAGRRALSLFPYKRCIERTTSQTLNAASDTPFVAFSRILSTGYKKRKDVQQWKGSLENSSLASIWITWRTHRVLARIYRLGEKSRVAEGHELPRGVRGRAPPELFLNEYALQCNLVHFETQFWEMLQWYFILFFSRDHVLTMLHLAPIFFGGKLGILGGKLLPLKYPR